MVQAVALEMRRRDFRAGDLSVGYQSCDDSVARTGLFDESKCAANAGAYLSHPRVVGVVGTVNSPCTVAALPVLNGGPEPPPAVVSPLNSYIGLTRPAPGSPPGELEKLYPNGERNFARVFPADDHQATALADVVERVGAERVFTLDDGDPLYGGMLADRFAREARARNLEVVGSGRWEPPARDHRRLAARVAAADPDALFLGGTLESDGAAVLRAVRQRVGAGTAILVPDGFSPTDLLADQAGDAADGVYVSLAGLITEDLPEDGRRFAAELGETLPGVPIEPSAIYAAAATGVLMDAIAGSDGSRPSVIEEVLATDADRTAIGPVRFDENGDLVGAPVTVLRIEPGARELPNFPDAVEEAVVRP
jgi:branched-chain amino acid transport system substrate-binding protein